MSRPTHRTLSSKAEREAHPPMFLQPMFDFPVPRPHAGKKSTRTEARPWERTIGGSTQPPMSRHDRRALRRHLEKHHGNQ